MTEISEMTNEELNNAVAVEVMGWEASIEPKHNCWGNNIPKQCYAIIGGGKQEWSPTVFISQAWEVVDKMKGNAWHIFVETLDNDKRWVAYFSSSDDTVVVEAWHESAPRAICEVALNAIRENK